MKPEPHFVYFVHWPKQEIVKVGCSRTQRWRAFRSKGGELIHAEQFASQSEAFSYERAVHGLIRQMPTTQRAFESAEEAKPFLGSGGGGWQECYRVSSAVFGLIRHTIDGGAAQLAWMDEHPDSDVCVGCHCDYEVSP